MAGKEPEYGPTANTVAENVQRLRDADNLTFTQVSDRLEAAGWPLTPVAVRRIEQGSRRVTVDDLMALAVALKVSPSTLLTPYTAGMLEQVSVTGVPTAMQSIDAHGWIRGDHDVDPNASQTAFVVRTWPLWMLKNLDEDPKAWGVLYERLSQGVRDRGDDQ